MAEAILDQSRADQLMQIGRNYVKESPHKNLDQLRAEVQKNVQASDVNAVMSGVEEEYAKRPSNA